MGRPKVNLFSTLSRDPDYFAVGGSPRSRSRSRTPGCLGGGFRGNRSPCRGSPENWFRAEYAPGFRERRTFGKDDARRRRRDATRLSRAPGALKGAPKRRIGRPVGRSVGRSVGPLARCSVPESRASLNGLGMSFRVGPQPARPLFCSLFLSSPAPRLLCASFVFLSLSLFRAQGAHGSDPESSTALPRMALSPGRAALSRVLLLFLPRYLPRPCVPSSLCVAR